MAITENPYIKFEVYDTETIVLSNPFDLFVEQNLDGPLLPLYESRALISVSQTDEDEDNVIALTLCFEISDNIERNPRLENGHLIIQITDTESFTLNPIENLHSHEAERCPAFVKTIDGVKYSMSKDNLIKICESSSLKMKLTGLHESWNMRESFQTGKSFRLMAKAVYNAVYDGNAYREEILSEQAKEKEIKDEVEKEIKAESDLKESLKNSSSNLFVQPYISAHQDNESINKQEKPVDLEKQIKRTKISMWMNIFLVIYGPYLLMEELGLGTGPTAIIWLLIGYSLYSDIKKLRALKRQKERDI